MKKLFSIVAFAVIATACNENNAEGQSVKQDTSTSMTQTQTLHITTDMVVNKKDFACGMPTSAGITDTCHYQDKAYGFCSPECKAEFQNNPEKFLASNK